MGTVFATENGDLRPGRSYDSREPRIRDRDAIFRSRAPAGRSAGTRQRAETEHARRRAEARDDTARPRRGREADDEHGGARQRPRDEADRDESRQRARGSKKRRAESQDDDHNLY